MGGESAMQGAQRLLWLGIVAVFVALAVAAPAKIINRHVGHSASSAASHGTTVHMAGLKFSPGSLVVPKATTVIFDNNDVAPHTVTSDDGAVDSGVLGPGKSFSLAVTSRLSYFCAIHPFMKAKIDITG
jgi:plastocyanin